MSKTAWRSTGSGSRDIADELLDEAIERGSFDLLRDCVGLLPMLPIRVICDLLGLSQVDAGRFGHHQAVIHGVRRSSAAWPRSRPSRADR
ncbi:hypothetical protein [Saccharopolyspora hattusasensis]|uniref:hypothetical protein n=1 Tax=Saccharopolyspora hattusasensis TaxID=1128679 RepID=UPI003D963485